MGTTDIHSRDLASPSQPSSDDKLLFYACFIALIATAFGFVVRGQIMESGEWVREFHLSKTEMGQISGVALWPFAISIVLFSLVIDKIGYGKAMIFAFVCHLVSAVMTISAKGEGGKNTLYWAMFLAALANGTVEAVINPVVATLFKNEKTKWLNMLHAGWPGGLVLGGLLAISLGTVNWRYKIALIFIPVIGYGIMMLGKKFPVNERVAAGAEYKPMLQQVGVLGAAIVVGLIVRELGNVFSLSWPIQVLIGSAIVLGFGAYVRSLGQPLFVFLLLIMIPLATTELGTDSWIGDLMSPEMKGLGLSGGWVLIYTSLIMMILRFFAGPIVHKVSPLGLLALSAAIAACGLVFLSKSSGLWIIAAATLYGFGKTFFWPTMLGVVAEQFPKGGALTLNTTGGVGMLAVGIIGTALLGNIQDKETANKLKTTQNALYSEVVGETKTSVFGVYQPLDQNKVDKLVPAEREKVMALENLAKKDALMTVAIFPCIMLVCYLALIVYFRSQGGYKAKILISPKEEGLLMTGGAMGPAEM